MIGGGDDLEQRCWRIEERLALATNEDGLSEFFVRVDSRRTIPVVRAESLCTGSTTGNTLGADRSERK